MTHKPRTFNKTDKRSALQSALPENREPIYHHDGTFLGYRLTKEQCETIVRFRKRDTQRDWLRKRRAEFFAGKQCVDCGSVEQLELDHINPAEKVSHKIWSWSAARREEEIAKCAVRCHACHRKKTTRQLRGLQPVD